MRLCLSCNQPCSVSSVFCDACRLALLERRTEEEQAELVGVGERERLAELTSLSHTRTSDLGTQSEAAGTAAVEQTEGEPLWCWEASDLSPMEVLASEDSKAPTDTPLMLPSLPFTRWVIPKPVRLALLIFLLVGALALIVDSFLLVFSLARPHTHSQTTSQGTTTGPASKSLFLTPGSPFPITSAATATVITVGKAFSLSTSNLSFAVTQGRANPPSQAVMLSAGERSSFSWEVVSTPPSWLKLSSTRGNAIAKAQLTVNVRATRLAPNTYTAHLLVKAVDSHGSVLPDGFQPLIVVLSVLMPCSLNATPTKIFFRATLLQPVLPAQTLSLSESNNCARPVNWKINSSATWVRVSDTSGQDTGTGSTIKVRVTNPSRLVGTFQAYLTLQATDNHSMSLSGSPITIPVTLIVNV